MSSVKCPKCYSDSSCYNYIYRCSNCGREFCKCPKCGRYNTNKENNIWYCYECNHEFGAPQSE